MARYRVRFAPKTFVVEGGTSRDAMSCARHDLWYTKAEVGIFCRAELARRTSVGIHSMHMLCVTPDTTDREHEEHQHKLRQRRAEEEAIRQRAMFIAAAEQAQHLQEEADARARAVLIPASVNGLGVRPPPPTLALPDLEEMEDEVFLEAPGRDADYDEDMGCGDPSNRAKPRAAWGDDTPINMVG